MSTIGKMNKDRIFDELLIMRCQSGDSRAFKLLVNRWHKKLVYFAYKYTHDQESASDIVQESWISIFKGIPNLREASKFSTWAYRVTYNKAIDYLRKNPHEVPLEDQHELKLEVEVSEAHLELETKIRLLISNMPALHQSILTLFYTEKQSIQQIADVLSIPQGTVKSRLDHARELLKRKLLNSQQATTNDN